MEWGEQLGFSYGAGAPVSGVFAAVAGELPLAPFTDIEGGKDSIPRVHSPAT